MMVQLAPVIRNPPAKVWNGLLRVVLALSGLSSLAADRAPDPIVAQHGALFTQPPRHVPTRGMPDGPLLGNGDVGVVLGGPPEAQGFYIGKNDFWTGNRSNVFAHAVNRILTVGRVELGIPQLQGASYRQEQDLARAEVRGTFKKDGLTVRTRSWVHANENLLLTEVGCEGGPVDLRVGLTSGETPRAPSRVQAGDALNAGREQYGRGRWYFDGEIADLVVTNILLSGKPAGQPARIERFDGKSTWRTMAEPMVASTVSVEAWIRINAAGPEANYIVSKGEWNRAYSLGLSAGCLRWAVNGTYVQSKEALPRDRWLYVAGTLDGGQMRAYVDGEVVASLGSDAGVDGLFFTRKADPPTVAGRTVAVASRFLGAEGCEVALKPGESITLATAILSDLDAPNFADAAKSRVAALDAARVAALAAAHRAWWMDFWSRSFIEIPDKEIEKRWYAALYVMGSCSRPGEVAPGLWGNWITTDAPNWQGDFHLNYNFQAPFYLVYGSNHADVSLPFYQAIAEAMDHGRAMSKRRGWKGVHFPCGIGPWGLFGYSAELDHGQRSNAAYVALNFIGYWQYVQDPAWLRAAGYPYLIEVANFWDDYLKFENGRYVIYNDAIHEGSGDNMNPLLSLGLLRTLYAHLIPMSKELGVDADRRAKWRDILAKLSAFPLQERGGRTVFRYSEKGTAWWDSNTLGIQHIFPGGAIGLDSDPKLLEVSRNTIEVLNRWADYNGFSSFFTAAARVGYDPDVILQKLRIQCDTHSLPNGLLYYGGGGIENCGGFLAVNEMLLQSHEGVIRFFPCWPKDQDAKFGDLRAVGAFLVSAERKSGVVAGVKIVSEKGRPCSVVNPWPGRSVRLVRGEGAAETVAGDRFTFKTGVHETVRLEPQLRRN